MFPGECFICSVTSDLKIKAECPEGWKLVEISGHWDAPAFSCSVDCTCPTGTGWKECMKTNCPKAQDLSKPCPEGFDFITFYDYTDGYKCVAQPPICNQCGSMAFGGNSTNGDIFCGKKN